MVELSKDDLRELLSKNWMTHDAMWLYHSIQEVGVERTNKINRAAVRSMGAIEVRRIKKLLGMDQVKTFADLKRLFEEGFDQIRPKFMKYEYSFPGKNMISWKTSECFAYDGIKALGLLDQYECGIVERLYGWFDGLGLEFSVDPHITRCQMHLEGRCQRNMTFNLPG